MATLSVQQMSMSGSTPTFTAASSTGDVFANNGETFIIVKNGGTASINVTIKSEQPCNQGHFHDVVIAVGAGAEKQIGNFDQSRFNKNGLVAVSYSAVTSVSVAAVKI